jgi:hypothetical protein
MVGPTPIHHGLIIITVLKLATGVAGLQKTDSDEHPKHMILTPENME